MKRKKNGRGAYQNGGEIPLESQSGELELNLDSSKILQEISRKLIEEENLTRFYQDILEAAVTIMDSDFASLQMLYPKQGEEGELRLLASYGFSNRADELWKWVKASSTSPCGVAIQDHRRVVVPDVEVCPFMEGTEDLEGCRGDGIRAIQATPLITRSGQVLGIIATHWEKVHEPQEQDLRLLDILARQAADIMNQKRSEEVLRSREERFRAMVSASSDLIFRMNADWSEMYYMEGQGVEEGVLKTGTGWFEHYVVAEDQERVQEGIKQAIRTRSNYELEHRVHFPDGSTGWISSRAIPITNRQGELVEWFGAVRNITDRKQAQKKLQEVNDTLEQRVEERTASLLSYQDQLRSLASRLSKAEEQERQRLASELHDNLGQMLAVSKMKVDLLAGEQLPQQILGEIEEVQQGIEEALVYTRDLMSDLKPPPSLDKEDVRASIEWVAQKMEKHDLTVEVIDDGDPKITTEEIRTTLLQCVRELLFNVIKHTSTQQARVKMKRLENRVEIKVQDEGEGFDMQNNELAPAEDGGFGLFNIQERLDLLGGSMEMVSSPGDGTTIILQAPLKGVQKAAVTGPLTEHQPELSLREKDLQNIRVVLADDHHMIREGLKKIVEAETDLVVVGEAASGQEAIDLAREHTPEVVVMDINMPEINGIEATQRITTELSNVRVIGLSLHDHQEVVDSMRQAGASAYLTKNEAFETLCATIRSEAQMARE